MLTAYIQSAMRQATYEILDDQTFYGEIVGFQGVHASADALEQCREELQSALEGWILLGFQKWMGCAWIAYVMPKFGPISRRDLWY